MKRITLVLGIVAVMVTMIVAPAMAKDNNGHKGGGDKANTSTSSSLLSSKGRYSRFHWTLLPLRVAT